MRNTEFDYLIKFIFTSALSFFIGSVHGVLQVMPTIRAWLDSVGSPYGGPGHMIDPLAHAHINLIGGVTLMIIASSYYLLQKILQRPLFSARLTEHSYWWTTIGIYSFYFVLMTFGTWEGMLLLEGSAEIDAVHSLGGRCIALAATIMGIGLWLYLTNVFLTIRSGKLVRDARLRMS